MLPELLFSVGSSMQDISREEFSLLNGGCDKDSTIITGTDCTLERIKLGRTPDLETVSIKLEEPDIFPWHATSPADIGSNLLRHSDDPLISGAIDDNQNEFNPIKTSQKSKISIVAPTSPHIITPPRKKVSRTRRKGQFKLRFHHQALPQEYLDHYEATQNSLQKREAEQQQLLQNKANSKISASNNNNPMEVNDQLQAARTHDSVRNWLQKISEFQGAETVPVKQENDLCESAMTPIAPNPPMTNNLRKSSRVVSYNDLPYMGEMTLDNSKPRRGRKPKKADICHLIYKNYGTILPGTPKDMMENNEKQINTQSVGAIGVSDSIASKVSMAATTSTASTKSNTAAVMSTPSKKSEIQAKLIGSLLEKRLTNESKKQSLAKSSKQQSLSAEQQQQSRLNLPVPENNSSGLTTLKLIDGKLQAEPLNLCVRDRSDTLTVSSDDDDDNDDEIEGLIQSASASPLIPPSETDSVLATNLKMSLPNFQTALLEKPITTNAETPVSSSNNDNTTTPPGYVYWPSAGVFIHPMALYYHKMVDAGTGVPNAASDIPLSSPSTISTPSVSPMSMPSPSPPNNKREQIAKILIPKNISQLMKQQDKAPLTNNAITSLAASETSSTTSSKGTTATASSSGNGAPGAPQKRKRSAIFIPPMPVESSSNHATEVSICKFKFTGGAKPSLQEKKMLSVDSGGNFRYYSGTGDKSMRGYEFFPRESLQQSSLLAGSSAGAFLNTPGEKISIDLPPPSQGLSNEVLQIPDIPNPAVNVVSPVLIASPSSSVSRRSGHSRDRSKRKSRRSLQREKLEKTFKEKGFLIQTQQLESAEGATYCKFRQLRKFTRYLFRSWKDYLPGELQQGQQPGSLQITPELMAQHNRAMAAASGSGENSSNLLQSSSIVSTCLDSNIG